MDIGIINNTTVNTVSLNLSNYGMVGQYFDMTFNGSYNDSVGVSHTINGIVHVLRDN